MVILPALRSVLCTLNYVPRSLQPPAVVSRFPQSFKIRLHRFSSLLFSVSPIPNTISKTLKPLATQKDNTLILKKDERLLGSTDTAKVTNSTSTIAAIVTSLAGPPGAVGIVRLSGPGAVDIVGRVFCPEKKRRKKKKEVGDSYLWRPRSHVIEYGVVLDRYGDVIDEVLLVPMLAPKSYTREDVVELQCHGNQVCLHRVLRACLESGARLAEPGEFTLRAFLNGRLDLSQAENVGKLITAKSIVAADAALEGIQGGLSAVVKSFRNQCMELLAEIDARLDFDDEMPPLDFDLIRSKTNVMLEAVDKALETAKYDKLLQSGLQLWIIYSQMKATTHSHKYRYAGLSGEDFGAGIVKQRRVLRFNPSGGTEFGLGQFLVAHLYTDFGKKPKPFDFEVKIGEPQLSIFDLKASTIAKIHVMVFDPGGASKSKLSLLFVVYESNSFSSFIIFAATSMARQSITQFLLWEFSFDQVAMEFH